MISRFRNSLSRKSTPEDAPCSICHTEFAQALVEAAHTTGNLPQCSRLPGARAPTALRVLQVEDVTGLVAAVAAPQLDLRHGDGIPSRNGTELGNKKRETLEEMGRRFPRPISRA